MQKHLVEMLNFLSSLNLMPIKTKMTKLREKTTTTIGNSMEKIVITTERETVAITSAQATIDIPNVENVTTGTTIGTTEITGIEEIGTVAVVAGNKARAPLSTTILTQTRIIVNFIAVTPNFL